MLTRFAISRILNRMSGGKAVLVAPIIQVRSSRRRRVRLATLVVVSHEEFI